MSVYRQLLTPLSYLRIKHPLKYHFDYVAPFLLALLILLILYAMPVVIVIFGEEGLVSAVTGLIQMLTGFFIASLAAVSTFHSKSLDNPLAGEPAILQVNRKGKSIDKTLTRREFVSYLFGYLAFLALVLYFVGIFSNLLADNLRQMIPLNLHACAKWLFTSVYLFGVSSLLITTLFGLHYMIDRIHRD